LAFVLLREEKEEEAVSLLEDITKASPGYAQAHYSLGKTLVERGQLSHGISELEEAVQDDPGKAYSHYQLGRAYMRAGKEADARRELELASKLKDAERNHQPAAKADPNLAQ
jgi:Flp pilus assembly protein TadD